MRFFILFAFVIVSACSPLSRKALTRTFNATEEKFQDHTGFVLYDPGKKRTLYDYNGARYFTPASNTKILTLYTSLVVLGDSIPGLQYIERGDSLIFWGTGDPAFLYTEVFDNGRVFNFLKNADKQLYFSNTNFHTAHFGSGWAWDDYNFSFSPERSPFPIYGNCFNFYPFRDKAYVWPGYFKPFLKRGEDREEMQVIRNPFSNEVMYHYGNKKRRSEWTIPFHIDQDIIVTLLADTLQRPVTAVQEQLPGEKKVLYSVPVDSVYKVMMQQSDNLIAEQLLMMCAGVLSDSLQPEIAIDRMKKNHLGDLEDEPLWVDGSGLSRYNLFTPRAVVEVWKKIYALVPRERLFAMLATGGKPGTIRNWYFAEKPYVFGKTGTLSNNHALSGFLVTKSGKTLIFSFMNANFTTPTNEVRANMQRILKLIYENY